MRSESSAEEILAVAETARALQKTGRSEEALRSFDSIISTFGEDERPEVQGVVATCLLNQAIIQARRGALEVARATADRLLRLLDGLEVFEESELPRRADELYNALLAAGDTHFVSEEEDEASWLVAESTRLGEAGRLAEAIEICEEVLSRFGQADYAGLRNYVAEALFNKAIALREAARRADAVDVLAELQRRFENDADPGIRATCAMAMFNQGVILADAGETDAAIGVMKEVDSRFREDAPDATRQRVARALLVRAGLVAHHHLADGLRIYDEILELYPPTTEDPTIREVRLTALLERAIVLERLGQPQDAIREYAELADEAPSTPVGADALKQEAEILFCLNEIDGAAAAYLKLIEQFGEADDPKIRAVVVQAWSDARLFLGLDRPRFREHVRANSLLSAIRASLRTRALGVIVPLVVGLVILLGPGFFPDGLVLRLLATIVLVPAYLALVRFFQLRRISVSLHRLPPVAVGALLLTDLSGLASEPWMERVIVISLVAYVVLMTVRTLREIRAFRRLISDSAEVDGRISQQYLDGHRAAARIILEWRRLGRPYVLYLRSFDLEAAYAQSPHRLGLHPRLEARGTRNMKIAIESALQRALAGRAAIIAIANPTDTLSWGDGGVPGLELPHDGWQDYVRQLSRDAAAIVVAVSSMTPGVVYELELLLEQDLVDRVLVFLSAVEPEPLLDGIADVYHLELEAPPLPDASQPPLSRFPHVILEEEIGPTALEDHPSLTGLLSVLDDRP